MRYGRERPAEEPRILVRAVPGALVVTIDGNSHTKIMGRQALCDLAEDCLRAARETVGGER